MTMPVSAAACPQRLPRVLPQGFLHAGSQEHAGAQVKLLEMAHLVGGALRIVDGDEAGADQTLGRARAELREPLVVGAIAHAAQLGVGDQQRDDRSVHHGGVDAVPVHVGQPQRRGRRPQHAGLEHPALLQRHAAAAHRPRHALAPTPRVPASFAADPVGPLGRVDHLRRPLAPCRRHALLPEVLGQPLHVDVVIRRDDAIVHAVLTSAGEGCLLGG